MDCLCLALKPKILKLEIEQVLTSCLFITIIITIPGHLFEIYTMVSEICDNVDLVLGVKNFVN